MELDFGINQGFVEEQYLRYRNNPASVDPSWRKFFEAFEQREPALASGAKLALPAPVEAPPANGQAPASPTLTPPAQ